MFRHIVALLFLAALASSRNERRNPRTLYRDTPRGGPSRPETMFGRYGRASASVETSGDDHIELIPKAIEGIEAQKRTGISSSYGPPLAVSSVGHGNFNGVVSSQSLGSGLGLSKFGPCENGFERTIYGKCVPPLISQDLYIYKAPSYRVPYEPVNYEHKPKVHLNFVFIKSPSIEGELPPPVVVPPPKEKTHVYLLSKKPHGRPQQVIEVPSYNEKPEVFFVGYKEGENPGLPGGIDLQTALSQAVHPGSGSGGFINDQAVAYGGGYGSSGLVDVGHQPVVHGGKGLSPGLEIGVSSVGHGVSNSGGVGSIGGGFPLEHDDGGFSKGHGSSIGVGIGSKGVISGGFGGSIDLHSGGLDDGSFSHGHDGGSISAGLGAGSFSKGLGAGSFSKGQGAGSFSSGLGAGSFSKGLGTGSFSKGHGGGGFSSGLGAGSFSKGLGGGSFSSGLGAGSFSEGLGGGSFSSGLDAGSFSKGLGGGSFSKSHGNRIALSAGHKGSFSGSDFGGFGGTGFSSGFGGTFDLSHHDSSVDDLIHDLGKGRGGFKNPGFKDGLSAALANDDIDEIVIDHGIQDVGKPKVVAEIVGSLHGAGVGPGSLTGLGGGHGQFGAGGHGGRLSPRSAKGGSGATAHVKVEMFSSGGKRFERESDSDDSLEEFKKYGGSILKAKKVVLKNV